MNITQLKRRAKQLKSDGLALYFAYRDPRLSKYVKMFIVLVVGYALSPIDLIPDFIPIQGFLDDLVLVPLGIAIINKMIPDQMMEEARERAIKSKNYFTATVIIAILISLVVLVLLKVPPTWMRI
ncbi:MAG: YkvA family protein [Syntrophomonadaceae bacterium]|nr:YkvA family protein [Syntrophomonadaceae bacterium]